MSRHDVAFVLLSLCAGCERAPAEPEPVRGAPPVASAAQLIWQAPPTWNVERTAERGLYRAKYSIPTAGDAKHPAEVLVSYLGRGKPREIEAKLDEILAEFEGEGSKNPTRERFEVGAFEVQMLEVGGTYRFPMGPTIKGRAAAHVIKENWRAIAFTVVTPDRGSWLFRMVGPSDTVAAARSSFRAMIEGLR